MLNAAFDAVSRFRALPSAAVLDARRARRSRPTHGPHAPFLASARVLDDVPRGSHVAWVWGFQPRRASPPRDAQPRAPCVFETERAESTRIGLERGIFDARGRRVVRAIGRGRPLASGSAAGRATIIAVFTPTTGEPPS